MRKVTVTASVAVLGSIGLIACMSVDSNPPYSPVEGATDARAPLSVAEVLDEDLIPCAPRTVLRSVCQRCHQNPPIRGAPFPLVTHSNIAEGNKRERMIAQLTQRRMPARPETIDEASRSTLLDWLDQGAPPLPSAVEECTFADGGGEDE